MPARDPARRRSRIALLDSQQWIKDGLEARIGPVGTDLVFTGTSALLHALTQSPTVPALNAAAALQQALEIRARRQVWRRRERELCRPEPEDDADRAAARRRASDPARCRPARSRRYRARLGPAALGGRGRAAAAHPPAGPVGGPAQGADAQGRGAWAGSPSPPRSTCCCAGAACCRWTARPTAGSTGSTPSSCDSGAPCAPARRSCIEANAEADGWDDAAVWTAAARLLGRTDRGRRGRRCGSGPPRERRPTRRAARSAPCSRAAGGSAR